MKTMGKLKVKSKVKGGGGADQGFGRKPRM